MPDGPKQEYLNARVEGAKTLSDVYEKHAENPEVFVAGVQYALDKFLSSLEYSKISDLELEHVLAIEILERAKRGEPQ